MPTVEAVTATEVASVASLHVREARNATGEASRHHANLASVYTTLADLLASHHDAHNGHVAKSINLLCESRTAGPGERGELLLALARTERDLARIAYTTIPAPRPTRVRATFPASVAAAVAHIDDDHTLVEFTPTEADR